MAPGTKIDQWPQSANLASSQFNVLASGSYWTIVSAIDNTRCIDAGTGQIGSIPTIQKCNGASSQQWIFQINGSGYGSAFIQNVASGNCLESSSDTVQGSAIDISDCVRHSWREFWILGSL